MEMKDGMKCRNTGTDAWFPVLLNRFPRLMLAYLRREQP